VGARPLPGSALTDWFAGEVAARYDDDAGISAPEVVDPVVDLLAELAGDGAALELAIGTGRIALPLAARGVRVAGIELSPDMAAQLRAKPGADAVEVTIGDMATTRVAGSFRVAYLVFNTINNLTTQDAQVACFRNAADHLEEGGCFVVEVGVPGLRRLPPGQTAVPFTVREDRLGFDTYDVVTQEMWSHHHWRGEDGWQARAVPFRYVWPSELDLMARLAGLRLRDRWAGWRREPFTAESGKHVSVWEKPA
jgi:SAM-dependent methyltransferase